jgi:hypothetical protein
MPGLMSGDWKRSTVSGLQRLQLDAWTAPDLSATAPALDSTLMDQPSRVHARSHRLNLAAADLKSDWLTAAPHETSHLIEHTFAENFSTFFRFRPCVCGATAGAPRETVCSARSEGDWHLYKENMMRFKNRVLLATASLFAFAATTVMTIGPAATTWAAPAQSHGVLTCAYLQEMYDYSISQQNYYWNQGTWYQSIGDTLEADADFGQYRRWSLVMTNIQLC